jgi:hypothetical protein
MMNDMKISKKILILGLLISAFAGCEKNPVRPEPESMPAKPSVSVTNSDSLSMIIMTIEDKRVNSLIEFSTRPFIMCDRCSFDEDFNPIFVIENNKAVLDSIPPGKYTLDYIYEEDGFSGGYLKIHFREDIELSGQQTVEIQLVIPEEIRMIFRVRNYQNHLGYAPVMRAEISTEPETVTLMTNDGGYVDFGMVPVQGYSFLIKKYDIDFRIDETVIRLGNDLAKVNDIIFSFQKPIIKIISPEEIHYQNNYDIHLVGNGYDFQDHLLPDSSLTWYSDIDGVLGKGRELFIPRLNAGNHTITLVGTDSQLQEGSASIQLNLSFFDDETYFPLPYTGYWNYHYETADFSVSDGKFGDEHWRLNDLNVSADDAAIRNCLLEYSISRGDSTKYCRYEVVDHYETDSENIYISKTTELLQIFENESASGEPTEQLDIKTVYSPGYLLIKQYMNPEIESSYETSGAVEVTWDYHHTNSLSYTLSKTFDISTSYTIGQSESIETGTGNYEAVPLTITSDGAERTWWLAKGIGIVRLSYDSFGFPLTATLSDTNVPAFSGVGPSVVMKSSFPGNNNNRIAFDSLPETPERMMELSKILRGLCPR